MNKILNLLKSLFTKSVKYIIPSFNDSQLNEIKSLYPGANYKKLLPYEIAIDLSPIKYIGTCKDYIYEIHFTKHPNGSITCILFNGWWNFSVNYTKYSYRFKSIIEEFDNAVHNHFDKTRNLSSRGAYVSNCRFVDWVYETYSGRYL